MRDQYKKTLFKRKFDRLWFAEHRQKGHFRFSSPRPTVTFSESRRSTGDAGSASGTVSVAGEFWRFGCNVEIKYGLPHLFDTFFLGERGIVGSAVGTLSGFHRKSFLRKRHPTRRSKSGSCSIFWEDPTKIGSRSGCSQNVQRIRFVHSPQFYR
jgi:hypothetical protein